VVPTAVALNGAATPAAVLAARAGAADPGVRRGAAVNSNTPPPVLEQLIEDSDTSVRRGVFFNGNASRAILERVVQIDGDERFGNMARSTRLNRTDDEDEELFRKMLRERFGIEWKRSWPGETR